MAEQSGVAESQAFARWCVLNHARPAVVEALRAWGLSEAATQIEDAPSLSALKAILAEVETSVRRHIRFGPLRRNLLNGIRSLQNAATFASRGDAENTPTLAISAIAHAASAMSWRRPWTRFSWKRRRAELIAAARQAQRQARSSVLDR